MVYLICKPPRLYNIFVYKFIMTISQRIVEEILSWPGVTSGPHRFGGIEFRIGGREMGHLHGDTLADIPFPMEFRNKIVNSGRASPHHILPQSGWISKWIDGAEDVQQVIELFRMQYERLIPPVQQSSGTKK
jgi:Family of unknown function (DUF5519)